MHACVGLVGGRSVFSHPSHSLSVSQLVFVCTSSVAQFTHAPLFTERVEEIILGPYLLDFGGILMYRSLTLAFRCLRKLIMNMNVNNGLSLIF